MTPRNAPISTICRLRQPQVTVRWRLAVLYGALFFASGAALLVITYALVDHATISRSPTIVGFSRATDVPVPRRPPVSRPGFSEVPTALQSLLRSRAGRQAVGFVGTQQRVSDLHQLEIESAVALGIMALLSTLLGWLVAGKVLIPLRTITTTTNQISETNLHERLAMAGPKDELRQLADTIDRLLERLEAAFDAQRRFVANASHELRTPLAMMRTILDVALGKPGGVPPQLTVLDANLREGLDQADRLLESFLVLARAQNGAVGDQTSVSLEQIVTAALAESRDAIAAKRIDVHTALAPDHVTGVETLLARMVENVIENAVRHNQPDGLINIAWAIDRDIGRLVVENGGEVLDQRRVDRLAEPFRRLGTERTHSQNGHGLGLSIVAAVAAAHGGALYLHARRQGGLRVEITLAGATLAQSAGAQR